MTNNNRKKKQEKERREAVNAFMMVSQIGITMIAAIAISLFIGIWLDGKLDTAPLFLLIFTFVGIGSAFKGVYTLTKSFWDNDRKK